MVFANEYQQQGQRCSNSNSSGSGGGGAGSVTGSAAKGGGMGGIGGANHNNSRSGKKQKQDKVPQRGLGVAELERILRDQQKSTNATASAAGTGQPPCSPASGLIIPPPPHLPRQQRPLPSLVQPLEPSSLFRPPTIPIPSPTANPAILPLPAPDSGLMGPPGTAGGMWNPYQIKHPESEIPGLPPPMQHYNDGLPDPVWLPQGYGQQRRPSVQQHQPPKQQPPPPPLSMVSTPISSSPSGVNNLQMEPPSNQINISSSSGSNCLLMPPWPEEERIGGMRPQWSFPLEGVPGNSYFSSKLPPFPRPEDLPSIQGLDALKFPLRNPNIRDGPSGSSALRDALKGSYRNCNEKYPQENGSAKGQGFLGGPVTPQLPPPSVAAAHPPNSSRTKQPTHSMPDNKLHEIPEFGTLHSFYAHLDGTLPPQFTRQLHTMPYYDFFPMKVDACETASTKQGGTPGDQIDLELKL